MIDVETFGRKRKRDEVTFSPPLITTQSQSPGPGTTGTTGTAEAIRVDTPDPSMTVQRPEAPVIRPTHRIATPQADSTTPPNSEPHGEDDSNDSSYSSSFA